LSSAKNDSHDDIMSKVINDVRNLMNEHSVKQMNLNEIQRKLQRQNPARYNPKEFTKDNLQEVFNHYKKL
jgi:uncharacterized membrane-anchored protein YjiN (DUF445 family)